MIKRIQRTFEKYLGIYGQFNKGRLTYNCWVIYKIA